MTPIKIPDGPSTPAAVQSFSVLFGRAHTWRRLHARYGSAFTINIPRYGRSVVLADPAEVRALLAAGSDTVDKVEGKLGQFLGVGSLLALYGEEHKRHRKLLTPPFHGRRLAVYEELIAQEAIREMATWPSGREFETMDSMRRITLNIILRAVFGAEGEEFDELRELLPRMIMLGSALVALPAPRGSLGRHGPWARFAVQRRRYDAIVGRLIDRAAADPRVDDRDDVLSMLLQSRDNDGSPLARSELADELLTLLVAGHETTASILSWTVERLRRHPELLSRLVSEADADGSEFREATLLEVQRVRPVVDMVGRQVRAESLPLGRWTLPRDQHVMVNIQLMHENEELFPRAQMFDPDRFVGVRPNTLHWIPFGGGHRRCVGAAFAAMEMDIVLRTLLREFTLEPTAAPDERTQFRGVITMPAAKGRAVVRRRTRA